MESDSHPLKPQRKHLKTEDEVTEQYPNYVRTKQQSLDPHIHNHKIEEWFTVKKK